MSPSSFLATVATSFESQECSLHFKIGKHPVFDPSEPKLTDGMGEKSLQGGGGFCLLAHGLVVI